MVNATINKGPNLLPSGGEVYYIPGVFSRNLVLCRAINAPLVYGESLYQDNEKECNDLMRCNVEIYGLLTSERVTKVAASYYEALFGFLRN